MLCLNHFNPPTKHITETWHGPCQSHFVKHEGGGPRKSRQLVPYLASLPATTTSSAWAQTAHLTNKKEQSADRVTSCYVASLPRGSQRADMGWIGGALLPSECAVQRAWTHTVCFWLHREGGGRFCQHQDPPPPPEPMKSGLFCLRRYCSTRLAAL